jgi:hypothetical protein
MQQSQLSLLQESDVSHGKIVLMKVKTGYTPMFYCDSCYPMGTMERHHTVNNQLSFSKDNEWGYFFAIKNIFSLPENISLFIGEKLILGNLILIFTGGYGHNSKRNWELAYFCGVMNNQIIAAKSYNPKTNNFTNIKSYPAMGKYIQ